MTGDSLCAEVSFGGSVGTCGLAVWGCQAAGGVQEELLSAGAVLDPVKHGTRLLFFEL